MRNLLSPSACLCVLTVASPWALAQQAPPQQTAAEKQAAQQVKAAADGAVAAAKKKGLTVVQALPPSDIDGDGKLDVVAVCKDEREELVPALFKLAAPNQVTMTWQGNGSGAQEIKSLTLRNMVADKRAEIVLEALEKSPDEMRRQLHVYKVEDGGVVREILTLSHEERAREEVILDKVSFGDDEPGYRITDVEGDGTQEVVLRREPKQIKVKGRGDSVVTLVIGIKELVYAWDGKQKGGGKYAFKQEKAVNFLPALKLKKVSASSQKLPDELAKAEQDRALEASFNEAFTEGGADGGPLNDDPTPVETNPAPRAFWATDNNFDTAWVEGGRGDGTGEWLEVNLGEPKDIRMVRVVPVCALDEKDAKAHNEITNFSLLFSGMGKVTVDRHEKSPSDNGVLAVLEIPAPERKFAPQVLVFLQKGTKSPWVRLVIDKAKKHSKANDACITEFSVH